MHHGQSRGETKNTKSMLKTGKFNELRGEILQNRGEIINFPKQGGNVA